jgi:hypothetical protein
MRCWSLGWFRRICTLPCVVVSFARSEFLSDRPFFYCVMLWVARWPAPPLASLGGGSSAGWGCETGWLWCLSVVWWVLEVVRCCGTFVVLLGGEVLWYRLGLSWFWWFCLVVLERVRRVDTPCWW